MMCVSEEARVLNGVEGRSVEGSYAVCSFVDRDVVFRLNAVWMMVILQDTGVIYVMFVYRYSSFCT